MVIFHSYVKLPEGKFVFPIASFPNENRRLRGAPGLHIRQGSQRRSRQLRKRWRRWRRETPGIFHQK